VHTLGNSCRECTLKIAQRRANPLYFRHVCGTLPPVRRKDWTARLGNEGAWIEIPVPEYEGAWRAAGLFHLVENQVVLSELRIIPNAGKYISAGGRPTRVRTGQIEWAFGPVEIGRGAGEWSRQAEDLRGPPANGVPARALRKVPLGMLLRLAQEYGQAVSASVPKALPGWDRAQPVRPGRAGRPDYFYAVWAQRYVAKAGSRRPIPELAEEFADELSEVKNPTERISGWLDKARRLGLLVGRGQGKAGGTLTPKGVEVLRDALVRGTKPKARRKR
jgi:hypothetical protein